MHAPSASGDAGAERLRQREQLLSTLLANLQGMVYRCRNDDDWTMEFVSEGCLELTGYAAQDLVGNRGISYEQLIHPEDRARVRAGVEAALQGRRHYELEYRLLHRDGGLRWVWERGAAEYAPGGEVLALDGIVEDVTEHRRAEDALREAERRFRSIFENTVEGIFQSTPQGEYITVNPALARLYGYDSPSALIGQLRDIGTQLYVEPRRRAEFVEALLVHGSVTGFESQVYRRDGSIIWISENARVVRDARGAPLFFEGTVEAITERKRAEATIRHQATHDALTGLPNRVLLNETLQRALAQRPEGALVALAFIDLDQFKLVNDTLGHEAGDRLLRLMGQRLQACVGPAEMVARQGGDEFVVLFGARDSAEAVRRAAEAILEAVARPCDLGGREFAVTCSIGISVAPTDGNDMETLLRGADAAMYSAKDHGGNALRFFAPEMNAPLTGRLGLLAQLHHALERGEFRLVYEPKCEIQTRRITGVEALVRWHAPDGVRLPAEFIGLAEDTGLILPIGNWVLRAACAQNRAWRDAGLAAVPVSVNLSRRQLAQPDFAEQVAAILAETGLEPGGLELEVTENVLMHDVEGSIARLDRIRALGVGLSMDDFGTGYSSLAHLRRLPVQTLKIDRSFLREVTTDADSAAIVRAIVSLARELGVKSLAEGVETEDQLAFLRGLRCDEVQGWHLSRPQNAAEFALRLRAGRA